MRYLRVKVGAAILAASVGGVAAAGWPCLLARSVGGDKFPDRACGPRVYGPFHEPVGPIDQCDACATFRGCNGYRQLPEMLAPWQLPPGRGFVPPEAVGYVTESCAGCADCGPGWGWPRAW